LQRGYEYKINAYYLNAIYRVEYAVCRVVYAIYRMNFLEL